MSEHDHTPATEAATAQPPQGAIEMQQPGAPLDELTEPAHPLELALRHGLRYSGLRRITLDPRLLLYVPYAVCERETVLPLRVDDERIELATASPDPDLAIVRDRFAALEIELVFAPRERIVELRDELKAIAR